MAHFVPYDGKNGRTWGYVVYVPDRENGGTKPKWKRGFKTKKDAKKAALEIERAVSNGTYGTGINVKLEGYIWDWFEENVELSESTEEGWSASTIKSYRDIIENHIVPKLGHLRLGELKRRHVNIWVKRLMRVGGRSGKGISQRTAKVRLAVLSSALQDAVDDEYIENNPAANIKVPKTKKFVAEVIDAEMASKILALAEGSWYYMPIHLGFGTGLRRGELAGLKWSKVDLDKGELIVDWQRRQGDKGLEGDKPKSESSVRTIKLTATTVMHLRVHLKHQKEVEFPALGKRWDPEGYVFVSDKGDPIKPQSLLRNFKRIAMKAGCSEKVRLHDVRHSHATILVSLDVNPKIVQERLGHSDIAITFGTYVHSTPKSEDDAVRRFDDAMNSVDSHTLANYYQMQF